MGKCIARHVFRLTKNCRYNDIIIVKVNDARYEVMRTFGYSCYRVVFKTEEEARKFYEDMIRLHKYEKLGRPSKFLREHGPWVTREYEG